jgi:hypothetical protein
MQRIRRRTQTQFDAAVIDFEALSADLARHLPNHDAQRITQLTSLIATAAMIESESLRLHLADVAAITLQAEATVQLIEESS